MEYRYLRRAASCRHVDRREKRLMRRRHTLQAGRDEGAVTCPLLQSKRMFPQLEAG